MENESYIFFSKYIIAYCSQIPEAERQGACQDAQGNAGNWIWSGGKVVCATSRQLLMDEAERQGACQDTQGNAGNWIWSGGKVVCAAN